MTETDYQRLLLLEHAALPEHAVAFDDAFKVEGGRANIRDFGRASSFVTSYHEQAFRNFGIQLSAILRSRGSDQTIYCDAIASPLLNAVAMRADSSRLFVGITTGAYLRLRLALAMLIHNVSMSASECTVATILHPRTDTATVGYVGRYRAADLLAMLDDTAPTEQQWRILRDAESQLATTDTRVTGAVLSMAADFILLHECMHVVNGHVDELQQRGVRRLWHRETTERYEGDSISRGCEADADVGAGTILGRALLGNSTGVSEYDFDRHDLFYLLAFAVGCTVNLFDISAPTPEDYASTAHPHHELRYLLVVHAIRNALAENDRDASHEWESVERQAFSDVRVAFERAGLGGSAFHYLQPVLPSTQIEALTSIAPELVDQANALLSDGHAAQQQCRRRFGLPVLFRP